MSDSSVDVSEMHWQLLTALQHQRIYVLPTPVYVCGRQIECRCGSFLIRNALLPCEVLSNLCRPLKERQDENFTGEDLSSKVRHMSRDMPCHQQVDGNSFITLRKGT